MGSIIHMSNLADVKPFKTSWSIHVKVLHTWKSCNPQFGSSLDMVLSDENVGHLVLLLLNISYIYSFIIQITDILML